MIESRCERPIIRDRVALNVTILVWCGCGASVPKIPKCTRDPARDWRFALRDGITVDSQQLARRWVAPRAGCWLIDVLPGFWARDSRSCGRDYAYSPSSGSQVGYCGTKGPASFAVAAKLTSPIFTQKVESAWSG
ncbi:hypothetical protein ABBQ32_003745 [Trebouxia sp. C0010 RCD-2024]